MKNVAQVIKDGKWGTEGIFEAYELQEVAGANLTLSTDHAETDVPTRTLSTTTGLVIPKGVRTGRILKVKIRLNWAGAVNLEDVWIYQGTKTGDYESRMHRLFTSRDYLTPLVDDDEYEWDVDIPFRLEDRGSFYVALGWSGACGNIQGYIYICGITYEA